MSCETQVLQEFHMDVVVTWGCRWFLRFKLVTEHGETITSENFLILFRSKRKRQQKNEQIAQSGQTTFRTGPLH